MNNQQNKTGSKGAKALKWIKEKRFYIVLLCCIMAVSATYYLLDSYQNSQTVQKQQRQSSRLASVSPTPTPAVQSTPQSDQLEPAWSESVSVSTPADSTTTSKETGPITDESMTLANAEPTATPTQTPPPAKEKLAWPISGEVLKPFSTENLLYSNTLGDWRAHSGIDIKAEIGTKVSAAGNGVVESIAHRDDMGITITIDHKNGLKSIYCNLSSDSMVYEGQEVAEGDIISGVGDTALFETGDVGHLHFEILEDGQPVDPAVWLK